ncbi:MAG: DNA-binding protein [Ruminococcus sp.]|nr:DNA-binding protein [Ruminococcus sp.]
MLNTEKEYIISVLSGLLRKLTEEEKSEEKPAESRPAEMLTIKECVKAVHGVSEHSIRQIVAQGKVKSVRTGEGKRGKILVNKADLLAYFGA